MTPEELSLQALESHLCDDGFACKRAGALLPYPAFGMEFRACDAAIEPF